MRRWLAWAGALLVVIGLLPVLSVFSAIALADLAGCELHEGFVNPCVIAGRDRGETLYAMFVLGWLGLLSLPVAALGGVLLGGTAIAALIDRLRR